MTFYENRDLVKTKFSQFGSGLSEAVHPSISGSTGRTWHRRPRWHILRELGRSPNGHLMLTGPYPLHDVGTIFLFFSRTALLPLLLDGGFFYYATHTWLNRTWSCSILKRLRSSILATMIRAMFVPCLATARVKASRYLGIWQTHCIDSITR